MHVALRDTYGDRALVCRPTPFVAPRTTRGAVVICEVRSSTRRSARPTRVSTRSPRRAPKPAATPGGCRHSRSSPVVDRCRRYPCSPRAGSPTVAASRPRSCSAPTACGSARASSPPTSAVCPTTTRPGCSRRAAATPCSPRCSTSRGARWPDGVAGRALHTGFVDEWPVARASFVNASPARAPSPPPPTTPRPWAGEASGFVTGEPAGEVVRTLVAQAAGVLARRSPEVLDPSH